MNPKNSNQNHFIIILLVLLSILTILVSTSLPHVRPPPSQRKFNSTAIEMLIKNITNKMADEDLATLFSNCLPNTLDTTVEYFNTNSNFTNNSVDSYIITGDINASWLRDSMNQVLPYIPLINQDSHLKDLICGVIHRQSRYIIHDSYANSFNFNNNSQGHQNDKRKPKMTPLVFEGKYELDSLLAFLKISWQYWHYSVGDLSCFNHDESWIHAVNLVIETISIQQESTKPASQSPYTFERETDTALDTLIMSGIGSPAAYTGMSKSMFRGSDDSCTFNFHVPSNAMAVVELNHVAQILNSMHEITIANAATNLAAEINSGIEQYGIVNVPRFLQTKLNGNEMFAYEVDGYGGQNLMDDANIPSLLSLPYLGYLDVNDPIYQTTRTFLLSELNPYYWSGSAGQGIGGPHEGLYSIWPMSIIMQALTSQQDDEIMLCLTMLKNSSAGTGFIHETFNKDNVYQYTRKWFAWVNSLFGELIIKLAQEKPHLIFKPEFLTVDQ